MSNHRPATDPGPSLPSIWTMAAATLAATAYSVWIAWGAVDTRHWLGAAMGFLLAVMMGAQTVGRAIDRDTARARQARHQARRRPVPTPDEAVAARWPQPIPQANPAPEDPREAVPRGIAEDLGVDPSPAALAQMPMPIDFRRWSSEADRQRWLAEQDTRIISHPPDWQS